MTVALTHFSIRENRPSVKSPAHRQWQQRNLCLGAHGNMGEHVRQDEPGGCLLQQGLRNCTYSCAHLVANAEVEAALLVHGVVDPRQFWEFGPSVLKGVV